MSLACSGRVCPGRGGSPTRCPRPAVSHGRHGTRRSGPTAAAPPETTAHRLSRATPTPNPTAAARRPPGVPCGSRPGCALGRQPPNTPPTRRPRAGPSAPSTSSRRSSARASAQWTSRGTAANSAVRALFGTNATPRTARIPPAVSKSAPHWIRPAVPAPSGRRASRGRASARRRRSTRSAGRDSRRTRPPRPAPRHVVGPARVSMRRTALPSRKNSAASGRARLAASSQPRAPAPHPRADRQAVQPAASSSAARVVSMPSADQ